MQMMYQEGSQIDILSLVRASGYDRDRGGGVSIGIISELIRLSSPPDLFQFAVNTAMWFLAFGIGVAIANSGTGSDIPRILIGVLIGSVLLCTLRWLKAQLFDHDLGSLRTTPVSAVEANFHANAFIIFTLFNFFLTSLATSIFYVVHQKLRRPKNAELP